MRGSRVTLVVVAAMVMAPFLIVAQQQPIHGCSGAISCRPLGFSTLNPNARGAGSLFFGVGFAWSPGFQVFIAAPQNILIAPQPTPGAGRSPLFHLDVSLPPPTPSPAPTPTPAPRTSAS